MSRYGRPFGRNLIFIILFELFRTACAHFAVRFALNTDLTDDQLASVGTKGILKNAEDSAKKFDLINYDSGKREYSFHSMTTNVVYMYGDIMVLNQHADDETDDDFTFHFMFQDDHKCREFQRQLNPTTFHNGELAAYPVQLRLMDETLRSHNIDFLIRSGTLLRFHLDSLEMEIFMFLEGLPVQNGAQAAYLIVPENGFNIYEPRGKEALLFPSREKLWKYTLRLKSQRETFLLAQKLSKLSERRNFIQLNQLSAWAIDRYFSKK